MRLSIVGGCGHVGLPLGIAFARSGCQVDLLDVSQDRIEQVNRGEMPFFENGATELLQKLIRSERLRASSDTAIVTRSTAVIVTIGTPAGKDLDLGVVHRLLPQLTSGQLLILRSTVPAGTTDQLASFMEHEGHRGIDLAYCPERIVQGKSLEELATLPQLVAGVTPRAAQRAAALFRLVVPQVALLRPVEAELAKLFCNAYRYIQFAISNQLYIAAQQNGADFYKVYRALRHEYPRMDSFARAGFAAGPCLVKDTMHLRSTCSFFPLGEAALAVNESMPQIVVQQLRHQCDLPKLTVGILGMAFKPESDDPRDSLSYKLRDLLRGECRRVLCTDPYVADAELMPLAKVLRQADILVVGTPHECYRSLKCSQTVFDLTDSGCGADWNGLVVRRTQVIRQPRASQAGYLASRNGKSKQRKRA